MSLSFQIAVFAMLARRFPRAAAAGRGRSSPPPRATASKFRGKRNRSEKFAPASRESRRARRAPKGFRRGAGLHSIPPDSATRPRVRIPGSDAPVRSSRLRPNRRIPDRIAGTDRMSAGRESDFPNGGAPEGEAATGPATAGATGFEASGPVVRPPRRRMQSDETLPLRRPAAEDIRLRSIRRSLENGALKRLNEQGAPGKRRGAAKPA